VAESDAARSGLAAVLDRLAGLEARQRDCSFETLRSAVLAGERDAWKRFVEKYSRFAYTVALQLLSGAPDREEAAASIYARVFERLASRDFRLLRNFEGRCRFTTYLYRVVQSERKEHLRASRADPAAEPLEPRAAGPPARDVSPEPVLRPEIVREAVRRALAGLGPRERTLLLCRFRDGLKLREIAELFGFKDTNVAARALNAALARLDLLKALDAEHRLGEAEHAALARALRDEFFRLEQPAGGGARP
jgi:RNA polymerase sigma factor (sigma-70 family)